MSEKRKRSAACGRFAKKGWALGLSVLLLVTLTACGADSGQQSILLNEEIEPVSADIGSPSPSAEQGIRNLSIEMFCRAAEEGKNLVMSPLSAAITLVLCGQGTDGQTAAQIEKVLGEEESGSMDAAAQWLKQYRETCLKPRDGVEIRCADAIWLRDNERLQVNEDYLRRARGCFDADVYKAPFNSRTVREINQWCSDKTDGMIDRMLNKIEDSDVFYLLNGIAFDGKWKTPYENEDLEKAVFTCEKNRASGQDPQEENTCEVSMMYSTEYVYLENAHATGVIKPYQSGFSFVGILPKEGMTMQNFLASLDGRAWKELLDSRTETAVNCGIPEFKTDSSVSLKETLQDMGVTDLFDPERADLHKLAVSKAGNIWITNALQRTVLEVDRHGTKAASITLFSAGDSAAPMEEKSVILNRPFLYAVVDDQTNLPVFMGVMMDPQQ